MKKATKLLCGLLCIAMATTTALGGCAAPATPATSEPSVESTTKTEPEETEKNKETLSISVGFWDADTALSKGEDDPVLKTIQDKLNIKFEAVNLTWDDYAQKLQLWASSDALPDIFVGDMRNSNIFSKWANQGLLHEIPQALEAYPNLEKYLDSPESDTCKVGDKMYCLFRQTHQEQADTIRDRSISYRWDLAQKAGITKEPETWDEFRAMIQAIIKSDPEQKNIKGITTTGIQMPVGMMFTYSMPLAVQAGNTFNWVDNGDGNWVPAYFAGKTLGEDALPTWQLCRDMYAEGSFEPDLALATNEQGYNKFLNGECVALLGNGFAGSYSTVGQYWKEIHGTEYLDAVKCLDLMPAVDGKQYYWMWDYAWSESYISAKVDDVKMDRILQLYDYLLTREGVLLARHGLEGETYMEDENGMVTPIEGVTPSEVFPSITMFHDFLSWTPGMEDPSKFQSSTPQGWIDVDDARVAQAKALDMPERDLRYTSLFVSMGADFGLNLSDDMINIMAGDRPVAEMWNEIIDGYKAKGLEDIIVQVNEKAKELGYHK